MLSRLLPALVALAMTFAPSAAQTRPAGVDFRSSVNLVGQATGEDNVRSEFVGSLDLFADLRLGTVTVHAYVEANTTPRGGGVSSRVPFANMDAGSALGSDGRGRVQISEFRLAWDAGRRVVLHAGLMDLTGFLDVSRIANDENLFFLGQPFVNNPTIIFPDYTLGATAQVGIPQMPSGHLALSVASSHGLADNPGASYGELVRLDAPDKGVFFAGRLRWAADTWAGSIGGWATTSDKSAGVSGRRLPTRGLYSVLGISSGVHSLNGRLGLASGEAGTEPFVGLTYLGTVGANALGVGIARTPGLPSFVDHQAEHVETFLRRSIRDIVYLTASVQWLSEELLPEGTASEGVWIFGFRLSAAL
ncbi:MAG: hypothetical protein HKN72_01810 [Gemmatimonadetes bacterium]|nr:hypothetical protein [Gemmatimonadota bacterium]